MKHTIVKLVVGSKLFGTDTETSDTDVVEVFKYDNDIILSGDYPEEIVLTKDHRQYEISKFLKLLSAGNPNMLEILNSPICIEFSSDWELLQQNAQIFVTKNLFNTFSGYAKTQLRKSNGLNKKINWEKEDTKRKTVLDFCYIYSFMEKKQYPLNNYLKVNELTQDLMGLKRMDHFKNCYLFFEDVVINDPENPRLKGKRFGFNGVVSSEDANDVNLSNTENYYNPQGLLHFNMEGYSTHCKRYREYEQWLTNRNTERYNTNKEHKQDYDSKNVMHLVRLLNLSERIATTGKVIPRVSGEERNYLLSIKRGETNLKDIVDGIDDRVNNIKQLFDNSNLPENVDEELVKSLLLKIRKI
jgi:hypothetical protein